MVCDTRLTSIYPRQICHERSVVVICPHDDSRNHPAVYVTRVRQTGWTPGAFPDAICILAVELNIPDDAMRPRFRSRNLRERRMAHPGENSGRTPLRLIQTPLASRYDDGQS